MLRRGRLSFLLLALCVTNAMADDPLGVYRGSGSAVTAPFSVAGPWTLDWRVMSEFPELAQATIRLADAETGDFIAELAQVTGTADGYRLFPEGGEYRFDVIGVEVDWELIVEETDPETAARLLAGNTGGQTGRAPNEMLSDDLSSFSGWSAEDARTLILVTKAGALNVRIRLRADCPGLTEAASVSFVAPMLKDSESYDSILLEDGTRCYFESVSPTSR
jgi:hypothetical protein